LAKFCSGVRLATLQNTKLLHEKMWLTTFYHFPNK
jgi:hypothetical protein